MFTTVTVPPTATSPAPVKPLAVIVKVKVAGAGPDDGGGVGAVGESLPPPQATASAARASATPMAGSIQRLAFRSSTTSFMPYLKGNFSATRAPWRIDEFIRKTRESERLDLPAPYGPRKRLRARKNMEPSTGTPTTDTREFETHRGLLFSIAYRMLGSATDAEDVVQDAWLRYSSAPPQPIRSARAWLATVVTRLCLDRLKAARSTRELYVGPWLPEPMLHGDREPSLARAMEQKESISLAFLVLLESLTPHERAVFLLREVFDYDYRDIAEMLELSPVNCRQLFHRAKQRLNEQRPGFDAPAARPSRARHERFVQAFMAAVSQGDMQELQSLLHNDVVFRSDGGGKVAAAIRPVLGRESVARFFIGVKKKVEDLAVAAGRPIESAYTLKNGTVNGAPAIFAWVDGSLDSVMSLSESDDGIMEINLVRNPDKLTWLMRELSHSANS